MNEEESSSVASGEVVADTHAIIWYLYLPHRLSRFATDALDNSRIIHVSAISLVEIAYLIDKGRFDLAVLDEVIDIIKDPGTGIVLAPISLEVSRAVRLVPYRLVPDMPDRIITATALHLGFPLVTADSQIHSSGIAVIW